MKIARLINKRSFYGPIVLLALLFVTSLTTMNTFSETIPLDNNLYLCKNIEIIDREDNYITYRIVVYILNQDFSREFIVKILRYPIIEVYTSNGITVFKQEIALNKTIHVLPETKIILLNLSLTVLEGYRVNVLFDKNNIVVYKLPSREEYVYKTLGEQSKRELYPLVQRSLNETSREEYLNRSLIPLYDIVTGVSIVLVSIVIALFTARYLIR